MSDSNVTSFSEGAVTWVPDKYINRTDSYGVRYGSFGDTIYIEASAQEASAELDDDVRLCIRVYTPAPTWSQEPPTEAGWYWMWNDLWHDGYAFGQVFIEDRNPCPPQPWVRLLWDDESYPMTSMEPGTWYMPATVPQPPTGEVVRTDKEAAE